MRKRLLSVLLALTITLGFTGCAVNPTSDETSTADADYSAVNSTSDEASAADADYSTEIFGKDIITINITASEEDWDYLIENATSKPYISADVEIDGVTYDDVGIKTKGNTSLTQVANSDSDRYSLKINFDKYVDGQDCYGLDSLVLNSLYSDTSYLKEYMSYALMDYMDIPSSLYTFADIYVNGEHYGFFLALEDVDESFLERNYGEDYTGEAYKPESVDMEDNGGDMGGGDNAGGGDFGNMSFDITSLFTLTDSAGNEMEWSSVLPEEFDSTAVAKVTYADGSTADFNMRDIMSADLSGITALTDENGVTVDISTYTLALSANMPQSSGGMQSPGGQESSDSQTNDSNEAPQMSDGENTGGGMQNPGSGGNGMDGGSLGVDLVYTDDEISSYSNIFDNAITDVKEEDEARLIETLKAISEGENLEDHINVDEVLRYAAVNVFLVNLDSYFSNMGHNYCLYEDGGQLSMIPWDYNLSFGTYNSSSASDAINYAIDTVFSGVSAEDRPIIGLLLENEEYLERYHQYLSELAEYVTSGQFEEKVDTISSVIGSYVQNDATSFDGYDAFKTGVEALKTFASLRAESVSGQLNGTIPSTEEDQVGSDALIDTSTLDLSDLGTMGGGNGQGENGFSGGVPSSGEQGTAPSGEGTAAPGSDDSQNP
ncbi:MAG: CotH kinase family protein [Oscillospiraceae bacterium]|nr:CotH kinase family protein [Oscillospiraceae bacterium]